MWVDDEIDLLKPHILFLIEKGYEVITFNNGSDAVDALKDQNVDLVFLDEQMLGISGLETLDIIKNMQPSLPIVMITKSEEESIMNQALGAKISDYLIKPVSPGQVLIAIKKLLETKQLMEDRVTSVYRQEFRNLSFEINAASNYTEWETVYKKLVHWDMELSQLDDEVLIDLLREQKQDANKIFSRYIERNYLDFARGEKGEEDFEMSHTVMRKKLFRLINNDVPVFFVVIDNLRYDHWKTLQSLIEPYMKIITDSTYMSILPSVTHYARNSMFAGLMPSEIEKKYPQYWIPEDANEYKNQYEKELLSEQLKRFGIDDKFTYNKVLNQSFGMKILDYLPKMMTTPLNVIIYNFVDMLSHASTEVELLKEMAADEKSYRAVIKSWFEHSSLFELIKTLSTKKAIFVLTSDHGSIRITNPVKIKGDRETSVNLRYKAGRNLEYDPKFTFAIRNPLDAFIPKLNATNSIVFAKEYAYFVYPNNFNQYVNYYRNTIQHGGISMDEMIVPFVIMQPK